MRRQAAALGKPLDDELEADRHLDGGPLLCLQQVLQLGARERERVLKGELGKQSRS